MQRNRWKTYIQTMIIEVLVQKTHILISSLERMLFTYGLLWGVEQFYPGLKPNKLLGHKKVVGLGLYAEGKAQSVMNHERKWNWVIWVLQEKWVTRETSLCEKWKELTYSKLGAQITPIWSLEDTGNHEKLPKRTRRLKISTSALKRGSLPNLCRIECI